MKVVHVWWPKVNSQLFCVSFEGFIAFFVGREVVACGERGLFWYDRKINFPGQYVKRMKRIGPVSSALSQSFPVPSVPPHWNTARWNIKPGGQSNFSISLLMSHIYHKTSMDAASGDVCTRTPLSSAEPDFFLLAFLLFLLLLHTLILMLIRGAVRNSVKSSMGCTKWNRF